MTTPGAPVEQQIVRLIAAGASDMMSPALAVLLAGGVSVPVTNTQTLDTILNSLEQAVSGAAQAVFGIATILINIPLALLPSSSGHAALAMPLLSPLADFAGVSRATTITVWIMGHGLTLMVSPTSVVLVGGWPSPRSVTTRTCASSGRSSSSCSWSRRRSSPRRGRGVAPRRGPPEFPRWSALRGTPRIGRARRWPPRPGSHPRRWDADGIRQSVFRMRRAAGSRPARSGRRPWRPAGLHPRTLHARAPAGS